MAATPRSVPTKTLAQNLPSTGTTLYINNSLDWDGVQLSSASFGDQLFATLRNATGTQVEYIELDPNTVTSANAITILKRGLGYNGGQVANTETKYAWNAFDTYVELGTNPPQLYAQYVKNTGNETIAGLKTFATVPATFAGDPNDDNELARKAYVDSVINGGPVSNNRVIVAGNAGATVSAGQLVYLDVADGEWKLCDADTAGTVDNIILGIAQGAGTDGAAITGGVLLFGLDSNQSGLTNNTKYYASNTAGAISNSAGTTEVTVGISRSTTSLLFWPRYDQQLTEQIKDALAGTGGTPSSSNRFVTESGGVSSVRKSLPEENTSGILAGYSVLMKSNGEVTKNATIKNFVNTDVASIFSISSAYNGPKNLSTTWLTDNKFAAIFSQQTGTSSRVMIAVGYVDNNGQITIQGLDQVDTTNTSLYYTSICRLSDTKFIIQYSISAAPNIIQVVEVSNTNIFTLGTSDSISAENNFFGIARLSDTSFIFTYRDPASDDCYVRTATVSGTTITWGSAVAFDANPSTYMKVAVLSSTKAVVVWNSNNGTMISCVANISGTTITQGGSTHNVVVSNVLNIFIDALADDKVVVSYLDNSTNDDTYVAAATVSGDTISWGTPVLVHNGSTNGGSLGIAKFGKNGCVVYHTNDTNSNQDVAFTYVTVSGTTCTLAGKTVIADDWLNGVDPNQRNTFSVVNGHLLAIANRSQTVGVVSESIYVFKPVFNQVPLGIAASDANSGTVSTILSGLTGDLYTDLTFGKRYLFMDDGTISENGIIPGGVAVSDTELLIK